MLSVIIPSYNEELNIENTAKVLSALFKENNIETELLFVDDGSKDKTYEKICKCAKEYKNVKGISFSRNFGKEAAIYAGLKEAKGDCAVILDCDLQFPPEKIIEMYSLWQEGFEIVEGVKSDRGNESVFYKLFAKTFYKMMSYFIMKEWELSIRAGYLSASKRINKIWKSLVKLYDMVEDNDSDRSFLISQLCEVFDL